MNNLKNVHKSEQNKTGECPGCHAVFSYQEEASAFQGVGISRYGVTSPECIATFSELLGKEREWFGYPPPYRYLVDAYAVQHPPHAQVQKELGTSERFIAASKQSVVGHLIALHLLLEKKKNTHEVSQEIDRILSTGIALEEVELSVPEDLGALTVADVAKAITPEEYVSLMLAWAETAWQAWSKDHTKIRELYKKLSGRAA